MPRTARIDIPGLLQHVIVRGIERSKIFLHDTDREDFVDRLSALLDETETSCYAWSLLDNHFHLLLQPTRQSLASVMRRLLTGYAVSFNRRHSRFGHLFQNRYKSIVCDADNYFLELVRYIHLNPVRAGRVKGLDALTAYRWSGHRQLMGGEGYHLLAEEDVLRLFGRTENAARKLYSQFLADGLQWEQGAKLSQGGRRVSQMLDSSLGDEDLYDDRILGGGDFVARVLGSEAGDEDRPLELDEILEKVAAYYAVDVGTLSQVSKQRTITDAKAIICFLATRRSRLPGVEVAKHLCYSGPAVSRAAIRGKGLFEGDEKLRQQLSNVNM